MLYIHLQLALFPLRNSLGHPHVLVYIVFSIFFLIPMYLSPNLYLCIKKNILLQLYYSGIVFKILLA